MHFEGRFILGEMEKKGNLKKILVSTDNLGRTHIFLFGLRISNTLYLPILIASELTCFG